MKRIWILCGGPSTEHEVSLSSGREVAKSIDTDRYLAKPVVITKVGRWLIPDRWIKPGESQEWIADLFSSTSDKVSTTDGLDIVDAVVRLRADAVDCVFLALHGQFGEDGCVQGFLETIGVAYTGSGVLASAVSFDKGRTLQAYREAGLPTARGVLVTRESADRDALHALRLPVFVKPVQGGSSVGVTMVSELARLPEAIDAALAVDTAAIVEERIEGVEVSCGVLDLVREGARRPTALEPTEIRPLECEYFDYSAKYVAGKSLEITPAELPAQIISTIQAQSLKAHRVLCCSGLSRTDMIVTTSGEAVLLETNTLPGLTVTSLLPKQAAAAGIDFTTLTTTVIEAALADRAAANQSAGRNAASAL